MFLSLVQRRKSCDALPGISGFGPLRNKYSKLKLNSEVLNESL